MPGQYKYRPWRFYVTCFAVTWAFWIAAAVISASDRDNGLSAVLMLFGLLAPAVTAVITVLTSGSAALKQDLKRKLVGFYRVKPLSILMAIIGFMVIVALSILLSTLFGQSLDQFAFTEDFSFSIGGTSVLLTLAYAYFKAELKDGTPFTVAGAEKVKRLGICSIVLSLVSMTVTEIIYESLGLSAWYNSDDFGGVTLGICLILLSMILKYGAELEQKNIRHIASN